MVVGGHGGSTWQLSIEPRVDLLGNEVQLVQTQKNPNL